MNILPVLPRLINSKNVPPRVRESFRKAEESNSREQDLWRVLAAIAVLDACGETIAIRKPEDKAETIEEAIKWFHEGENTQLVLDLAGVDPDIVIEVMRKEFPLK